MPTSFSSLFSVCAIPAEMAQKQVDLGNEVLRALQEATTLLLRDGRVRPAALLAGLKARLPAEVTASVTVPPVLGRSKRVS